MRSLRNDKPAASEAPESSRSKKTGTIATWHTNRHLEVVGATAMPDGPIRAQLVVGQVISAELHRRGFLRYAPHAEALQGKTSEYGFRLLKQRYVVRLQPRMDRRGRILGVRGLLTLAKSHGASGHRPDSPFGSDEIAHMARKHHRNSVQSAIRSLELARSAANIARVNAEIRKERAAAAQEKAYIAQMRAEQEERRARFLADASSMLDTSFDQRETLGRLARLIVLRMADWLIIYFIENDRPRRIVALHRDEHFQATLETAFPEEEEPGFGRGFTKATNRSRAELFAVMTPEDVHSVAPTVARRRFLKDLAVQSMVRTPIVSHGRLSGVLLMGSSDPGRLYDLNDLQMVRDLANRIALARESSYLYEEAQREIAMRREIEGRMRVLNSELERRVTDRTRLLEEATREANSFAYTVAHDLRAPLRAITGFCQALREDYSASVDETGQDYLERIVSGARKMDDLIRDLLDYARINRADITKTLVDLDPAVDDALQQVAQELQELKADVQVAKPLGSVVAQGPVLVQVLTNLISNGAKFVAPGVRPQVRISSQARDRYLRILIQDNGIGIDRQHHDRIFGIFERLNRAEEYPGTGIGLAIVRRAMERLGGAIGVESEPGQGSTFWIELPSV